MEEDKNFIYLEKENVNNIDKYEIFYFDMRSMNLLNTYHVEDPICNKGTDDILSSINKKNPDIEIKSPIHHKPDQFFFHYYEKYWRPWMKTFFISKNTTGLFIYELEMQNKTLVPKAINIGDGFLIYYKILKTGKRCFGWCRNEDQPDYQIKRLKKYRNISSNKINKLVIYKNAKIIDINDMDYTKIAEDNLYEYMTNYKFKKKLVTPFKSTWRGLLETKRDFDIFNSLQIKKERMNAFPVVHIEKNVDFGDNKFPNIMQYYNLERKENEDKSMDYIMGSIDKDYRDRAERRVIESINNNDTNLLETLNEDENIKRSLYYEQDFKRLNAKLDINNSMLNIKTKNKNSEEFQLISYGALDKIQVQTPISTDPNWNNFKKEYYNFVRDNYGILTKKESHLTNTEALLLEKQFRSSVDSSCLVIEPYLKELYIEIYGPKIFRDLVSEIQKNNSERSITEENSKKIDLDDEVLVAEVQGVEIFTAAAIDIILANVEMTFKFNIENIYQEINELNEENVKETETINEVEKVEKIDNKPKIVKQKRKKIDIEEEEETPKKKIKI